jgi:hypothetical protein
VADADVFVGVGDMLPAPAICSQVIARIDGQIGIWVIHMNSNHDFYGSRFPNYRGQVFTT